MVAALVAMVARTRRKRVQFVYTRSSNRAMWLERHSMEVHTSLPHHCNKAEEEERRKGAEGEQATPTEDAGVQISPKLRLSHAWKERGALPTPTQAAAAAAAAAYEKTPPFPSPSSYSRSSGGSCAAAAAAEGSAEEEEGGPGH